MACEFVCVCVYVMHTVELRTAVDCSWKLQSLLRAIPWSRGLSSTTRVIARSNAVMLLDAMLYAAVLFALLSPHDEEDENQALQAQIRPCTV